jgi:hypothetical protein
LINSNELLACPRHAPIARFFPEVSIPRFYLKLLSAVSINVLDDVLAHVLDDVLAHVFANVSANVLAHSSAQ